MKSSFCPLKNSHLVINTTRQDHSQTLPHQQVGHVAGPGGLKHLPDRVPVLQIPNTFPYTTVHLSERSVRVDMGLTARL